MTDGRRGMGETGGVVVNERRTGYGELGEAGSARVEIERMQSVTMMQMRD